MVSGRFALNVKSLVCEPRNVVEFKYTELEGSGTSAISCLISPREARKLAEMLLDIADRADDLPVHDVRQ